MKRIYTILSCLLLVGMLCIGLYALLDKDATYSESERRKLKPRPKLTFSAMLDGSYASDYRDYFADTFPNREKLMNANRSLNGFYYFSGGSKDGAQLVINRNGGAANHGEALPTTDDTTPSASTQPSGTSGTATDSTEPTEPTQPTQTQDPDAAAEELGSVLVVGDRAMEVPYGDKDTIRSYADAVNDIAAKLGIGADGVLVAIGDLHPLLCRRGERHCSEARQRRAHVLHRRAECGRVLRPGGEPAHAADGHDRCVL